MIWYRHWLEIRGGLWVAAACVAVLCLGFPLIVVSSTDWFQLSGKVIQELRALSPALPEMGPERFLPWGVHTMLSSAAALIVGIFLAGTGIRTNGFAPGHQSVHYTLTLPVSRFELLWTRFAASCGAIYILFAAMLLLDCAVLAAMRRPIPFAAMAVSSLLAGSLGILIVALAGVVMQLWKEKISGLVHVFSIALAFNYAWQPVLKYTGSRVVPWLALGAIVLITAAALSGATALARRSDF